MVMRTSPKGVCEIAEHEGIVVAPYYDSVGVLTWGVGHTAAAGYPDPKGIPMAMPKDIDGAIRQAIRLFSDDLLKYEARVTQAVKVPITQHEFDALVSFDYNTGGIFKANLTKSLNAGLKGKAAEQFFGWLKPPEIKKRRTAEMNLFLTGDYDSNGDRIPVWGTNGKGKLTGIIKTISSKELLKVFQEEAFAPLDSKPNLIQLLLEFIKRFLKK